MNYNYFIAVVILALTLCGCNSSYISIVDLENGNHFQIPAPESGDYPEYVGYVNEKNGYFITFSQIDNKRKKLLMRCIAFNGTVITTKTIAPFCHGTINDMSHWACTDEGRKIIWCYDNMSGYEIVDFESGFSSCPIPALKDNIQTVYETKTLDHSNVMLILQRAADSQPVILIYNDRLKQLSEVYKYPNESCSPRNFFYSPSSHRLYIDEENSKLTTSVINVIEIGTRKVVAKIPIDGHIDIFTVNKNDKEMFLFTQDNRLLGYDLETQNCRLIKQFDKDIARRVFVPIYDGQLLCLFYGRYEQRDNFFSILDPETGEITKRIYCNPSGRVFLFDNGRQAIVETH